MNTSEGETFAQSPGRWPTGAQVAWGAAFSLLVGTDGSLGWRVVRFGVVIAVTALALWLSARTRRLGDLVTLSCGTIGLAVGIVFGLRFLTVDGLSWRAVAGLVMLIVGLVLVATGVRRFVSGLARGWGFVTGAALAFVVLLAVWTLTPALLATNVPPIPTEEATPDDFGLAAREVRFEADAGVELFAWYVPPDNGAALVLRHGSGSTSSSVSAHAEVLARHGYGVLATDARGHARSSGRAMDFGWYGNTDIDAAVSFLAAQPETDPETIAVLGLSMGGEEGLGAAVEDPRIAAVLAEGATGRTEADKAWIADTFGARGSIQTVLELVQFSLTDLLTDASKPISLADAARAAAPRPVLLIAAGKVADEGHAAAYIQQHAPASVTIWVVPEAGHTQGLSVAPAMWERAAIGFLDAVLIQ